MTLAAEEQSLWFYEKNGARIGGVSEQAIVDLISSGSIQHGTLVWCQGLTSWIRVEDSQFAPHVHQLPPPLTGDSVNNTIVWVLAFAPIIGLFLEGVVAMIVYDGNEYRAEQALLDAKYWYITVLLNIGLSFLDEFRLKKAGQDTSSFRGWVWLVPVYLFQRAKRLKQNQAYFITWMACFALTFFI
jgi:hypothetical protein